MQREICRSGGGLLEISFRWAETVCRVEYEGVRSEKAVLCGRPNHSLQLHDFLVDLNHK